MVGCLRGVLLGMMLVLALMVLQPVAMAGEASNSVVYRIERTYDISYPGQGYAKDVTFRFYLLDNQSGWSEQHILYESLDTDGNQVSISSTSDNRYATVDIGRIYSGDTESLSVTQVIRVDSVNLDLTPDKVQGELPAEYQKYTEPVDYLWQSDVTSIQNKADELTENESNYYTKASRIFDYVQDHLSYARQSEEHSALWAYNHTHGDCSDYANLFIALCRAAGIPAKFISGYLYTEDSSNIGAHAFALIYLPNVGWAPVDATEALGGGGGTFAELTTDHLVRLVSDGTNLVDDSEIDIPGEWRRSPYTIVGGSGEISEDESEFISRVVAVEPAIYAGDEIVDSTWEVTVKVTNEGSKSVSNVSVRLQVDNTYFEAPPAKNIGYLGSGLHQHVYFDVHVKQSVENSPVTAVVTYDAGTYGTFSSEVKIPVTAHLPSPLVELPWTMLIILVAVIAGLAVGIAALLRR